MKKKVKSIIKRILSINGRIKYIKQAHKLEPEETPNSLQAKRCSPWFKDEGDKTHRLNYELQESSVVFDLGGYEGQWASDIYSMYNSSIWIFEPYLPFAEKIEARFKRNSKIKLFKFGLSANNENVEFSVLDNSSSMFQKTGDKDTIQLVSVAEFIRNQNIQHIDLIKINIEGAEYELLETLLDNNLVTIFRNIQVQFHDFIIENASERMKNIQSRLSVTHKLTYQYEFVWENWELKQ
jgi:FkbM family methyltransferase